MAGKKKKHKKEGPKYCMACTEEEHDTCSLTPGCPCCDRTIEGMKDLDAGYNICPGGCGNDIVHCTCPSLT